MILSRAIAKVREIIDDPVGEKWSDAFVASQLHEQLMALFRKATEIDERYHNLAMTIAASTASQQASNVWEYKLPTWVSKVIEVRRAQSGGVTTPRRNVIPKITRVERGQGWEFSQLYGFRLVDFATAIDLDLLVTKRPAQLTRGTLPDQTGMSTTQLRLDADTSAEALLYPHETETSGYANAIIEITGTNNVSRQPGGQRRRVLSSTHLQVLGSASLHTVVTLDRTWTVQPAAGDTYELHVELPEEHLRLLHLMVARACFEREGNTDEIRAQQQETYELQEAYVNHIRPRSLQEPQVVKEVVTTPYRENVGQDGSLYWDYSGF